MEMQITFPGGKRVDAHLKGQVVRTDQSRASGGDGSAPEPYLHFLASIGTCAGIYALGFCQARGIPTEGLRLRQRMNFDPRTHKMTRVHLDLQVPPDFPQRYVPAIRRAMDLCAVKRTILDPPQFEISVAQAQAHANAHEASVADAASA
jgi:ribosomal protein S12 methylthiotransferase accessory factor